MSRSTAGETTKVQATGEHLTADIARAGGAVGRVGVPQEITIPDARPSFYANITIAGGPAPVRAYVEELLPDVLEGRIEPCRVFDRVTSMASPMATGR